MTTSSFNVATSGQVLRTAGTGTMASAVGPVVHGKEDHQIKPTVADGLLYDTDIGDLIKATLSKKGQKQQFVVLTPEQSSSLYSNEDNEHHIIRSQGDNLQINKKPVLSKVCTIRLWWMVLQIKFFDLLVLYFADRRDLFIYLEGSTGV